MSQATKPQEANKAPSNKTVCTLRAEQGSRGKSGVRRALV
ncbi:hypothetical protein MTBPR1_110090 [Candidatus Terasakiella magnetica]|uniref:Uncharacterized protein n=1 Tax=Candidatus Terasakiella magnetica TaxID=1867952 RepID=A0A1C3REI6_9PROT|nr:hypothetical protein MTBPR1_110090 [Candidatus Terasakiella magnetica]